VDGGINRRKQSEPLICIDVKLYVLSRDTVTIDGVWIGNRIHWTLQHTARDYTLRIIVT
jgi:hypothetical protein